MTKKEQEAIVSFLREKIVKYNEDARMGLTRQTERADTEFEVLQDLLEKAFGAQIAYVMKTEEDDMIGIYEVIAEYFINLDGKEIQVFEKG